MKRKNGKAWMNLGEAVQYTGLMPYVLWSYIGAKDRPLPVRNIAGQRMIARDELDAWMKAFPRVGEDGSPRKNRPRSAQRRMPKQMEFPLMKNRQDFRRTDRSSGK